MKKKVLLVAFVGVLAAALALVGCSSQDNSQNASDQSADAGITLVEPGVITILTDVPFQPYEYRDAEGNIVGIDIDIMRAVADKLGYTIEVVPMDFDLILPAIEAGDQGDVGAAAITVDPDRAEVVDFTTAYFVDNQGFAVMDNSPITEGNAQDELNKPGVTIAVQSGTSSADYARENYPEANIVTYKQVSDAFAAMQAGMADVVCCNLGVMQSMLSGTFSDARIVLTIATGEEYAFAVSKTNPELTAQINAALAELVSDGTIQQIIDKYQNEIPSEEGEEA